MAKIFVYGAIVYQPILKHLACQPIPEKLAMLQVKNVSISQIAKHLHP